MFLQVGPQEHWPMAFRIMIIGAVASLASAAAPGLLRPSDLPGPALFNNWTRNETVKLPGVKKQKVAYGSIAQPGAHATSVFSVLPKVMDAGTVAAVLALMRSVPLGRLDSDPDTVDGMPTYEMFVDSLDMAEKGGMGEAAGGKPLDADPYTFSQRQPLRDKLRALLQPVLDERITPYIRAQYPEQCGAGAGPGRLCTPCYSLIRRYKHGERVSHATHHDGHAIVTAVVSLSDYGTDYRGGLYVATARSRREFLALSKGDAVVHSSTLLHGVAVADADEKQPERTERWSWILWYRDSEECEDHGHEWFKECAAAGSSACASLHATKTASDPATRARGPTFIASEIVRLNNLAADAGDGVACVKLARAYLKTLHSDLPFDATKATAFFKRAVASSDEPDAHYGLAQLLIAAAAQAQEKTAASTSAAFKSASSKSAKALTKALGHLESAAAGGHAFAMFNLALAHLYGYGTPPPSSDRNGSASSAAAAGGRGGDSGGGVAVGARNPALAAAWFAFSGLPEGLHARALFAAATGEEDAGSRPAADGWHAKARAKGFNHPWRVQAREHTGSGGSGGVSLNCPWPVTADGYRPPKW